MSTLTKSPLPHFLNLPLPPIPDPSPSPSSSHHSLHPPLVFKFTLSADQYEELLSLDAEVEEGEEGGLRLEFDRSGKGQLHLSPNRRLQLNPRPSRTNRPEEIYSHTPILNSSSSRPSLTGLLRIPTSTPVYDLQRLAAPDHSCSLSNQTRDGLQSNPSNQQPTTIRDSPSNQTPQAIKPSRATPDPSQREKEKLAGQRLKEKRLEEDRKKREKQMVVLPGGLSTIPPASRQKRQTKPKPSNKQPPPVTTKHQSTPIPSNTNPTTVKNQSLGSASQPPRRALPGSQSGKQLAHVHNQHLSNPPTPPLKPTVPSPLPLEPPPPSSHPSSVPAPQPTTFKRSSSNKRNRPPNLSHPTITEPQSVPPSEPPSATKLSTSTGLSSLSEEGEPDQPLPETRSHNFKPPSPPLSSLKHTDSPRSSPDQDSSKHGLGPQFARSAQPELPVPALAPAHDRPSSSSSLAKRTVKKSAAAVTPKSNDSLQIERVESPMDGDPPNSPFKKPRPDILTPNPTPPPPRPKKLAKRDGTERRPTKAPIHSTQSIANPSNHVNGRAEELLRKAPGITVKKISVLAVTERAPATHDDSVTPPANRKRPLDSESATVHSTNPLTKRVRQEEGVVPSSSSSLPTIRKVVRPIPDAEPSLNCNSMAPIKKIKKKKKVKQPVDYTSSEVEEGEEPGEIINTSNRTRPSGLMTNGRSSKEVPPVKTAAPATIKEEPATLSHRANVPPAPALNTTSKSNKIKVEMQVKKTTDHQTEPITRVSSSATVTTSAGHEETSHDHHHHHSSSSLAYKKSRLLFYELSKHYEYVCMKLKDYQDGRLKIKSLKDIEDLLFEVHGLEIELDRLRNRLIRNYL